MKSEPIFRKLFPRKIGWSDWGEAVANFEPKTGWPDLKKTEWLEFFYFIYYYFKFKVSYNILINFFIYYYFKFKVPYNILINFFSKKIHIQELLYIPTINVFVFLLLSNRSNYCYDFDQLSLCIA